MSRAKPEISHWGGSFTEDKFGTSDNPRTRDGKYKEAVDKGLNPEEELLAKEKGSESEEGFDSSDFSYVRADGVKNSFEKERQARRNAEEEAGWSPRKGMVVREAPDELHSEAVRQIAAEKARFLRVKGRTKGVHGEAGKRPAQKPVGKPQADKRRAA